jgi:uncharacterized membrane protein
MMRTISKWTLALSFAVAGALHFIRPDFYLRIMPDYLPWHRALVAISGACEIAGGLLVLPERTRRLAGWGLMALLVAVFPANIEATLRYGTERLNWRSVLLWARLPFQAVLIAWAWWTCLAEYAASDEA